MIRILFFGATADAVETRHMEIQILEPLTVRELISRLKVEHPKLQSSTLKFAVNQEYAFGHEELHDSDELAIFTAVSGG